MCMRQYQSLFGTTPVSRMVFTGDGAAAAAPCRTIAQKLGIPAQVGDPLARWGVDSIDTPSPDWSLQIRPGWAVAAGLAASDAERTPS